MCLGPAYVNVAAFQTTSQGHRRLRAASVWTIFVRSIHCFALRDAFRKSASLRSPRHPLGGSPAMHTLAPRPSRRPRSDKARGGGGGQEHHDARVDGEGGSRRPRAHLGHRHGYRQCESPRRIEAVQIVGLRVGVRPGMIPTFRDFEVASQPFSVTYLKRLKRLDCSKKDCTVSVPERAAKRWEESRGCEDGRSAAAVLPSGGRRDRKRQSGWCFRHDS